MKSRADLTQLASFADLAVDTDGNPCVWENFYDSDKGAWSDTWSCQCEDDGVEPLESTWIGPTQMSLRALWEALPEAGTKDPSPLDGRARRPSLTILEIAEIIEALTPPEGTNKSPLLQRMEALLAEELNPEHRRLCDAYRSGVNIRKGEAELDNDAEVSMGEDPGAYVMIWTWVSDREAGLPTEDWID